jgi:hypothetical protein
VLSEELVGGQSCMNTVCATAVGDSSSRNAALDMGRQPIGGLTIYQPVYEFTGMR